MRGLIASLVVLLAALVGVSIVQLVAARAADAELTNASQLAMAAAMENARPVMSSVEPRLLARFLVASDWDQGDLTAFDSALGVETSSRELYSMQHDNDLSDKSMAALRDAPHFKMYSRRIDAVRAIRAGDLATARVAVNAYSTAR